MMRRIITIVSLVLVLVAVAMVLLAIRSPEGLAGAEGLWGFVLAAVGVILGSVALWPAATRRQPDVGGQHISATGGDAYGVHTGNMHVERRNASPGGRQE